MKSHNFSRYIRPRCIDCSENTASRPLNWAPTGASIGSRLSGGCRRKRLIDQRRRTRFRRRLDQPFPIGRLRRRGDPDLRTARNSAIGRARAWRDQESAKRTRKGTPSRAATTARFGISVGRASMLRPNLSMPLGVTGSSHGERRSRRDLGRPRRRIKSCPNLCSPSAATGSPRPCLPGPLLLRRSRISDQSTLMSGCRNQAAGLAHQGPAYTKSADIPRRVGN
jgi:hypothetical protein